MKTSKLLLAGLVGGVVYFALGFLIYGLLMKDAMAGMSSVMRAEADTQWWAGILGNLVMGVFLAYVFARWANVRTLMGGLTAGAIIGAFIASSYDLSMYAWTTMMDMKGMVMDIVLSVVMTSVAGGVVGWMLGMGKE
ncbi:MAG: DUF1761 domain-containing protein [Saprospirales bacterium]|jgi:hypothetical protein|nr:DUF1761 domain-containing protein [Saprospirales bacterium]MBK6902065.1 DUF1761 domain-containing protein [Saprospirales bacterium]MBK7337502.1 DUF1761 domain-containing protein [Saprospirales bacterium]